ncbi:putative MAPEG superfamily protein [Methylopila capsulata]|uniref:MAPEG superfamily protein n=1 Tax=Methylopila capsulata TaxID=61654 RepID=A0A9W6MTI5_9HYPH|nr:MAPEG family protein [Methylopila capsulata]MBM7853369.1 putative MAPEG superfamily protein [Methylopila capsulata]GLK57418.1 membrane protein [Methylopila capsulata]
MPLTLWCVLIAGILPIFTVGLAKWSDRNFDNANPRGWADSLSGWRKRAVAAQQNGFEVFPLFAAAALVAVTQGADLTTANALAVAFILLRIAYVACYLADRPTLRSGVWSLGFLATATLFTSPAWS